MIPRFLKYTRLAKVWYTILVTFFQSYVVFNAIRQYILFKARYHDPRYGDEWQLSSLNFYIFSIITSLSLLTFFVYFCFVEVHPSFSFQSFNSSKHLGKLVWTITNTPHPYILHLSIAMCLLLPLPLVQMEDIRNEALSPDTIWSTDFDLFSEHFVWSKDDSLPNRATLQNIHYMTKSTNISIEFINFVIASLILVIKMPSVFWSVHKWFSIIFSILLFFHCLTWLVTYESVCILIKYSSNVKPLASLKDTIIQTQYQILLFLLILHFFFTLSSILAIFLYGNTQTAIAWFQNYKTFEFTDTYIKSKKCWMSAIVAGGFILLISAFIINVFIYTAVFRYFQAFKTSILIASIILGTVNMLLNFLLWFTFAIKTKWFFKLNLLEDKKQNENSTNESYKISGTTEAVYGCFHNNVTLSSSSSHSSGPGTMRTLECPNSEGNVGNLNNFQNYIYMQTNAIQIPTISEDFDENQLTIKSSKKLKSKISTSTFDGTLGREIVSISDTGINHSEENINSDSYRSLQLYDGAKYGKLVKFQKINDEENGTSLNGFDKKKYSSNNLDESELNFLKVPDILNMNRSNLSCSHSESSIERISSTASWKYAEDQRDEALCSQV